MPVINYLLEDGQDKDFDYYRRPGIIKGPDGTLVVYYEGQCFRYPRYQKLFCRVSSNNGHTWSERIELASGGQTGMLHNIMMVAGKTEIHCVWNIQYRQLWHCTSRDGRSWGQPEDLTRKLWNTETDYPWNAFGTGSGHGIRLKSGRILIPTWFTTGGDGHKPSGFANIYTDDEFQSVGIGKVLKAEKEHEWLLNPNEGAVVELNDGTVLATVRHDCPERQRAFCKSRGGTGEWTDIKLRPDLPDPICHASMERLETNSGNGDGDILFCNCDNPDEGVAEKIKRGECRYNWSDDARKNLTLRISHDGGEHFSQGLLLAEKGGYSDIAASDGEIICVYETGWDKNTETCIFPRQIGISVVPFKNLQD